MQLCVQLGSAINGLCQQRQQHQNVPLDWNGLSENNLNGVYRVQSMIHIFGLLRAHTSLSDWSIVPQFTPFVRSHSEVGVRLCDLQQFNPSFLFIFLPHTHRPFHSLCFCPNWFTYSDCFPWHSYLYKVIFPRLRVKRPTFCEMLSPASLSIQ